MQNRLRNSLVPLLLLLFSALSLNAQIVNPVTWDIKFKKVSESKATVTFAANIEKGWHMYSPESAPDGPRPLAITWNVLNGVELDGTLASSVAPTTEYDDIFCVNVAWWGDKVTLTQNLKITNPAAIEIKGVVEGQACDDSSCSNLTERFNFKEGAPAKTEAPAVAPQPTEQPEAPERPVAETEPTATQVDQAEVDIWHPVIDSIGEDEATSVARSGSLWYIFIAGFIGGLLALLTPCVWPMIPMTVSFFLKKSGSRSRSIRDASIYGVSIIVIYLLLGLLITLIFGASKLNELSTNAVFNIAFFLLLVVFAISFFGAFNIQLPSSWTNKMDSQASKTTGYLSIFFMAFTLTLVSFSCTGPIIGTLLVEAASMGDMTGPAIGMFGFALALAIPFSLFAIFPSVLKELPKSGGWLNSVKVVLGFIELALSLKFLSVADLAYGWHILDREVFLSLWIVMFALLGMYLLGKLRFAHDSVTEKIGVFRFFLAMTSLSFAVYLVPGLWGAPLKGVSAFVPPLYTQDFNLYQEGDFKKFDDFEEGMKYAKENNKPVLMDFSGYGCVNCRKMEAAVFDNPRVREIIEREFVLIELMVDDKTPLDKPMIVEENGREVELVTVGDRWSYLQRYKFGANSQPYYAVLDEKGDVMSGSYSYDENIDRFVAFLNKGIENFKK